MELAYMIVFFLLVLLLFLYIRSKKNKRNLNKSEDDDIDELILTDVQDKILSNIMKDCKVTGMILPSGKKVPSIGEWVADGGRIYRKDAKKSQ